MKHFHKLFLGVLMTLGVTHAHSQYLTVTYVDGTSTVIEDKSSIVQSDFDNAQTVYVQGEWGRSDLENLSRMLKNSRVRTKKVMSNGMVTWVRGLLSTIEEVNMSLVECTDTLNIRSFAQDIQTMKTFTFPNKPLYISTMDFFFKGDSALVTVNNLDY